MEVKTKTLDTPKGKVVFIHIELGGIVKPEEVPKIVNRLKAVEKRKNVLGKPVIISGRLPVWLYVSIAEVFHPHKWIATYDPRLSAGVVVVTHDPDTKLGEVIPVEFPFDE